MDGLKSLGLKILMAASEGGDIHTTIELSKSYLLTSNERSLALALLRKRANEEPPDAMVLTAIGEHYEKNGNIREAVNYYKAAVRLLESDSAKLSDEKESLKSDTPPSRPAPVPHAALPLAELYRKFGRVSEAKQYFEKAALQGDEPNAYWALAEIVYAEQNRYTENWLSYTYKAAVGSLCSWSVS
jgi:tetratricopeptide (TPR) repeat protein